MNKKIDFSDIEKTYQNLNEGVNFLKGLCE